MNRDLNPKIGVVFGEERLRKSEQETVIKGRKSVVADGSVG